MSCLVLSLFPGIGLLDRAFRLEGWLVVRGPDLLWGDDIRGWSPRAAGVEPGTFAGVIGGPPCQCFSPIGNVNRARYGDQCLAPDLIPEFRRVVLELEPAWWLMENSVYAYAPLPKSFRIVLENADLGEKQRRKRAFWSNLPLSVDLPALVPSDAGSEATVTSKGSVDWKGSRARRGTRTIADMLRLQGLPPDYLDDCPLTQTGKRKAIGNGVPIAMGRALARAVREAMP